MTSVYFTCHWVQFCWLGFMSHRYHHATIMWTLIVFKDGRSLCVFSFQWPMGSFILRIRNVKTASEECMCRSLHVSCDAAAAEVLSCLCAAGQWGWTEWRLNALCLISCDLWWESGKLLANSWLSYPGGLIIFNPVDELRPDLHAGGQSLPIQPNTQSIIIFNKVSFIFFSTRE